MAAPTARATVEQLLFGAVELLTSPTNPSGCLTVQGALACGQAATGIQQKLRAYRQEGEVLLRGRLERGVREGELSPDTDCANLARYFVTVVRGLVVSAVSGIARQDLIAIARTSLNVWPRNRRQRPSREQGRVRQPET